MFYNYYIFFSSIMHDNVTTCSEKIITLIACINFQALLNVQS